jgi:hypothetical protein
MSNVISTRPVGQPPALRKNRPRLRLSAVAAALGLFATLWSTMVGKTVPELLRSDEREVAKFHDRVDAACHVAASNLQIHRGAVIPPLEREITMSTTRGRRTLLKLTFSPRPLARENQFARRVTASFAALKPPAQLAPDYREFVASWKTLTLAMDRAKSESGQFQIISPTKNAYIILKRDLLLDNPSIRHAIVLDTPPIRHAINRIRVASIPLGLEECARSMRA